MRRLSLRFRAKDFFFGLHPRFVDKSEIRTIRKCPPLARHVPQKTVNGQVKDLYYWSSLPKMGVKFICALSNIFSAPPPPPPPPPSLATLTPKLVIFMTKQKSPKGDLRVDY